MNKIIQDILVDLYNFDPKLKKLEKKIIKMIKILIEIKPNSAFTKDYKNDLKEIIKKRINQDLSMINEKKTISLNKFVYSFVYFLSGFGVAGLIFIFSLLYLDKILYFTNNNSNQNNIISFKSEFEDKSDNAFGKLNNLNNNLEGRGGGGDSIEMKGIFNDNPEFHKPIVFNYIFSGNKIEINKQKMTVFKKESIPLKSNNLNINFEKIKFDQININNFSNLNVDNIVISEKKDFGYQISVDTKGGSLNIYSDFETWPADLYFPSNNVDNNDFPNEDFFVQITKEFIKEYQIDIDSYGPPFILENLDNNIELGEQKNDFPTVVNVIYPLIIDGKKVYNYNGNLIGLNFQVSVNYSKVLSVGPITSSKFISSDYKIINDFDKILSLFNDSKNIGEEFETNEYNIIDLVISNPKFGYSLMIDTNITNSSNMEEYIVPAIIFDVNDFTNNNIYHPNNIVVPIIEDFYK